MKSDTFAFTGCAVLLSAALLLGGCATAKPDFYPAKGEPWTLTFVDIRSGREVAVFDLRGEWEAVYPGGVEVIRISQQGSEFEGVKTQGNVNVPAGARTIYGSVEGNVVFCHTIWNDGSVKLTISKVSRAVDEFLCQPSGNSSVKRRR